MKLFFLCMSLLAVGGLCNIDDSCTIQTRQRGVSKALKGTCQTKDNCMKSGLATFSNSDITAGTDLTEEKACPDDDESVQCCVEVQCGSSEGSRGSNKCRNNVESNPCRRGTYLRNFRDQTLCPSTSSEDNVQCCVENVDHIVHDGLKAREPDDYSESAADLGGGQDLSSNIGGEENTNNVNPSGTDVAFADGTQGNPPSYLNLGNAGPLDYSASSQGGTPQNAPQNTPQSAPQSLALGNSGVPGSLDPSSQSGVPGSSNPSSHSNGISFDVNNKLAPGIKYGSGNVFANLQTGASIPSMFSSGLSGIGHSIQGTVGINFRVRRWLSML